MTGLKLLFYPLTPELQPDMAACRTLAEANPPDLFVLVHYFGRPAHPAQARDFCRHHGAWLIEDAAHVLRPVAEVGTGGDFVLYSPHKHLPVPDGSVLVVRPKGTGVLERADIESLGLPATWADQLHDLERQMGPAVKSSETNAWWWLVRRVVQKLGFRRMPVAGVPFVEPSETGYDVAPSLIAPRPSSLGHRLIGCLVGDLGRVARQRQRRQLVWDAALADGGPGEGVPDLGERSEGRAWVPYLGAYRSDSVSHAEFMYRKWQSRGLPVTTWPDLPPEVILDRDRHANAWNMRHKRLYLPVHQSLTMQEMVRRVGLSTPLPENVSKTRLVWDEASPGQWDEWMVQAGRSNLLQSWAYGEAKAASSGWRVRRGVFYLEVEPVAFVQVLQKSVSSVLRISRINRGPVFLKPPSLSELAAIWGELAGLGNIFKGKVLTTAPELELLGSHLVLMEKLGFRQFHPVAWESAWVDLQTDLSELRRNLDGKWRNALLSAEKLGLLLESGSDDYLFDWMVKKYEKLMREKGVNGAPVSLLLALRARLPADSPLLILRAVHEEEVIAGICLVRHGAAATYLLGWNGPAGRRLRANQFLLWNAIALLKQSGLEWFDLGGISEDDTPGIASFKLGLQGERYEAVGEYWKW
jgi:hypothetical protein